jgi:2-polyprenyl-3-methyl-5-hydroxy-6-metoxy-1,4-benzoquinol methylase
MKKINQEWWLDLFDTSAIGFFVPTRVDKKEVNFLKKLLDRKETILDLGCGTGRFSLSLAKLGHTVYALDANKFYLKVLEKEARKKKINNRIITLHFDMRNLEKLKGIKFDAVLLAGNTFGYFSHAENIDLLKNIAKILKSNGKLIIQQSNFDFVESNLKSKDFFENEKYLFLSKNKWRKSKNKIIIQTIWTIIDKKKNVKSEKIQKFTLYNPLYLAEKSKKFGLKLQIIKTINGMDWMVFVLK